LATLTLGVPCDRAFLQPGTVVKMARMSMRTLSIGVVLAVLFGFATAAQANTATILIRYTPVWVFPLFLVLVGFGLQALRPRVMRVWRPLILPTVFIVWGLVALAGRIQTLPVLGLTWVAAAVSGFILARATVKLTAIKVDRTHRLVRLRRSWAPLLRILAIFMAKYMITAASMLNPDARDTLAFYDVALSGAMSGYFIGWVYRFLRAYRQVASSDLSSTLSSDLSVEVG